MYILIENDKILEKFCGDVPEQYKEKEIIQIPDDNEISFNFMNIKAYDENWKLKPLQELGSLGFIQLKSNQKIQNNEIVQKSDIELMQDGLKEIPQGFKIVNNQLEEKTLDDKLSLGEISKEEYIKIKNQEVAEMRQGAYASESDPLFFKFQRGECSKEDWLNKIEEIKKRYPKV